MVFKGYCQSSLGGHRVVQPAELDTWNCGQWSNLVMCICAGGAAWLYTPGLIDTCIGTGQSNAKIPHCLNTLLRFNWVHCLRDITNSHSVRYASCSYGTFLSFTRKWLIRGSLSVTSSKGFVNFNWNSTASEDL